MANTRAVEEVSISGNARTKTSVFWSTVPENEQFRNVQVPGVAMSSIKHAKRNSQTKKYAQVVQKSKSDSAILNIRSDLLAVNKTGKIGHKLAMKQNDLSGKKKDVSSIFTGADSSDRLANMSSLSESSNPRRASLKNLNVEDKKRVANLIKELAKTGEERELALERLQEERVSFEERLGAVQGEQTTLRQERESLKQRLEKSEELLKKYESELKNVKNEKEQQEKMLKTKFQVQPESTQTSPLVVQALRTDGAVKSHESGIKKSHGTQAYAGESNDRSNRDGRMRWGAPQVPVYSNSLFDVKISNVYHEQNSGSENGNEEYQRSGVVENAGLHELYLREYSLQLRLQEQQIEIQRQQVQLQQQLQLLQQQQHRQQQQHHQEQHNQRQQPDQRQQQPALKHQEQKNNSRQEEQHLHQQQREISNNSHKQQRHIQEWATQGNLQNADQKQQTPYDQPSKWHEHHEHEYRSEQYTETISKHSPTQQTNLFRRGTPEPKGQNIEQKHDYTTPHEHARQRHKHDRHTRVVENSRQENEAVLYEQHSEPRSKDRSHTRQSNHYHHSVRDGEGIPSVGEHHTSRNKGTDHTHYHSEHHHVTTKRSPRKHTGTNDAKQVDINNNEYFQPRCHSPKQQKTHYDINDNLVKDREYLSESYSETDDQTGEEHHCNSQQPCHCGYYHNNTRQELPTSEYVQPISKHSHSKDSPRHAFNQSAPHSIIKNPHLRVEPHHTQTYHHPQTRQPSPNRTSDYHQNLMSHPNHAPVPPQSHHPETEYRHHRGTRKEHPSQRNNHYQHEPHYVTHKHRHANETAFDAVIYQTPQETNSQHGPTEGRAYVRHQSGSTPKAQLPHSRNTQVKITEHDSQMSDGFQHPRTQVNEDASQDLLDHYIYNHHTTGQNNAKMNADYPRDNRNKHSSKRKISRRREVDPISENEDGYPPRAYTANLEPQHEDENPSYSLYKPNIQETSREEHPRTSPGHDHGQYSRSKSTSYPDSLVEIVEDLEINAGYEERYSEDTEEVYSTDEPKYGSDEEEESTVLDNIFFLKR